jgi:hypothetical protein
MQGSAFKAHHADLALSEPASAVVLPPACLTKPVRPSLKRVALVLRLRAPVPSKATSRAVSTRASAETDKFTPVSACAAHSSSSTGEASSARAVRMACSHRSAASRSGSDAEGLLLLKRPRALRAMKRRCTTDEAEGAHDDSTRRAQALGLSSPCTATSAHLHI